MCHLLLQSPEEVFMEIRRPLEWHCKQMDHFVGLNFSANFNFALVGHLLKGKVASDRNNHLQTSFVVHSRDQQIQMSKKRHNYQLYVRNYVHDSAAWD